MEILLQNFLISFLLSHVFMGTRKIAPLKNCPPEKLPPTLKFKPGRDLLGAIFRGQFSGHGSSG